MLNAQVGPGLLKQALHRDIRLCSSSHLLYSCTTVRAHPVPSGFRVRIRVRRTKSWWSSMQVRTRLSMRLCATSSQNTRRMMLIPECYRGHISSDLQNVGQSASCLPSSGTDTASSLRTMNGTYRSTHPIFLEDFISNDPSTSSLPHMLRDTCSHCFLFSIVRHRTPSLPPSDQTLKCGYTSSSMPTQPEGLRIFSSWGCHLKEKHSMLDY